MAKKRNAQAVLRPSASFDEADELIGGALPPHFQLDEMSQDRLHEFAMRQFGRRPDEGQLTRQIEQVKDWLRGGRPTYPH